MSCCICDGDIVVCWVGDEFVVVMVCDDWYEVEQMVECLLDIICQFIDIGKFGEGVQVGISIGILMVSDVGWDYDEILEQVDRLFYVCKVERYQQMCVVI